MPITRPGHLAHVLLPAPNRPRRGPPKSRGAEGLSLTYEMSAP
jgi:hypothetical protein